MTPPYRGLFINLAESERRRNAMLSNLSDAGIASWYTRFPAVNGAAEATRSSTTLAAGALGLWLTHENIVDEFGDGTEHLHIMEDDVVVAHHARDLFSRVLQGADQHLGDWDLLFTETFVPFNAFDAYRRALEGFFTKGQISTLDLTSCYAAGMTSLFLNRKSIRKYAALIKGKWNIGLPIDIHVRQLIRNNELKAYVTIPFLSTISAENDESNIRGQIGTSRRICDVFRRGFFIDADLNGLIGELRDHTRGMIDSPLVQLYLLAYGASLSEKWEHF